MFKYILEKIKGLCKKADEAMLKIGKWKMAALIVAAWAVYAFIGKLIIDRSIDVAGWIMGVLFEIVLFLVSVVPYAVLLALAILTVLFVMDVLLKKKEV